MIASGREVAKRVLMKCVWPVKSDVNRCIMLSVKPHNIRNHCRCVWTSMLLIGLEDDSQVWGKNDVGNDFQHNCLS